MEITKTSYKLYIEKTAVLLMAGISAWLAIKDIGSGYEPCNTPIEKSFKLALCVLCGILALKVFMKGIMGCAVVCMGVSILHSPVITMDHKDLTWRIAYCITAMALAWVYWRFMLISRVMTPERVRRMQMAEARAKLIDKAIQCGDVDGEKLQSLIDKVVDSESARSPQKGETTPTSPKNTKQNQNEEVLHFVFKRLPQGVTRTKENTQITAAVVRKTDDDGKPTITVSSFAGADPLTFVETKCAIYWRKQIDSGTITDKQVIDGMHSIEQHTVEKYIRVSSSDPHPGDVAIISGLVRLSLHYAIGQLDKIGAPKSIMNWWENAVAAQNSDFSREGDMHAASELRQVMDAHEFDEGFMTHLVMSVTFEKRN